jgi:hypothetical protein
VPIAPCRLHDAGFPDLFEFFLSLDLHRNSVEKSLVHGENYTQDNLIVNINLSFSDILLL